MVHFSWTISTFVKQTVHGSWSALLSRSAFVTEPLSPFVVKLLSKHLQAKAQTAIEAGSILGRRLRRWPRIELALALHFALVGWEITLKCCRGIYIVRECTIKFSRKLYWFDSVYSEACIWWRLLWRQLLAYYIFYSNSFRNRGSAENNSNLNIATHGLVHTILLLRKHPNAKAKICVRVGMF